MRKIYGILLVVVLILIMGTNTYASRVNAKNRSFEFENEDININKLDEDLKWKHQYIFSNGASYIITDLEKKFWKQGDFVKWKGI